MLDFGLATTLEICSELGGRVRAQRLSQNLTQAELAERAGISINTLGALEKHGQCTLANFLRASIGLGLASEFQLLMRPEEFHSIAQMEKAELAKRVRARRKPKRP